MIALREAACALLLAALCLFVPVGSSGEVQTAGDVTAENAAYQYIVQDMALNREGNVMFYDLTYILSRLFDKPQGEMNLYGNSMVKHNVLLDLLWNQCGVDTTLIERNYANETEFLTYEQLFDALDYFYHDILRIHGMAARMGDIYAFSGQTRIAFDDGTLIWLEETGLSDGRAVVTFDGPSIIEISPLTVPEELALSSMGELQSVTGTLYYYSMQEKKLLLTGENGEIKRFEIVGNPACFAQDGVAREAVNDTFLDGPLTVYYTTYKKVRPVAVMLVK